MHYYVLFDDIHRLKGFNLEKDKDDSISFLHECMDKFSNSCFLFELKEYQQRLKTELDDPLFATVISIMVEVKE